MGGFGKRKGGGGSVILTDLQVDGTTVTVDTSNNRLGVGTASPKTELTVEGTLTMKEAANASGDTAAYGQLWIKNDAPCNLYFTDDTGQDVQITSDGSLAGVSGTLSGLGSNDNRVMRTNGTGGETAQGSGITVDDSANMSGVGTLGVGAITTSGDLTVNADSSTFTSANANDPLITIKNTTNDADGARLRFVKDKGAAGAANDVAGLIEFYADDAAQDQVLFSEIKAQVAVHTNGQEGGKLTLSVASHDGEKQPGLIIADGSVEDEIDVTIANGAASLTTISGTSQFNGAATFGVDDTGVDVRLYSATASEGVLYDASEDELALLLTTKLKFHDVGGDEEIYASSNGHLEVNAGATLDMTAPTVDINASTAVTIDGPAVTVADTAAGKPVLTLKTTHTTKTSSSELQFLKDAADTEDGEVLGQITFYGEDEGNNNTQFAGIVASISESDETDEAGKLEFQVAESDGTDTAMTTGLVLEGEHATDGQIDVTIAAGAASTTTVAGDLTVTTDLTVTGADITVGADADGTDRAITFGHSTVKSIMGIDDSGDVFAINTDGAFEAQNDFEIASNGGVKVKQLTINNGTGNDSAVILGDGSTNYWQLMYDAANADANHRFIIYDSASPAVESPFVIEQGAAADSIYADSTGVGIGTGAPSTKLHVSGSTTFEGGAATFSSTNASDPLITIKNTTNDANGARLRFVKDKGAAGAADDVAGLIEFYADDAAQDQVLFAKMEAAVAVHTNGQEGGKLSLGVATHDGEMQYGLVLTDGSAEDEIDVTIGNGAASLTTVAGTFKAVGISLSNNDSGTSNTVFGLNAGAAIDSGGNYNISIGEEAANDLTTGDNNVFVGYQAGDKTEDVDKTVIIGALSAGAVMTADADGTVAIGYTAGAALTSGQKNTAVGHGALLVEDDGDGCVAVGYDALAAQTGVSGEVGNTAVGSQAGDAVTTGIKNVLVGAGAGGATTDVDHTVVIGYGAGAANLTAAADGTIIVGSGAGAALTTGAGNTAIGFEALKTNVDGDFNTAVGYQALETFEADTDGHGNNTAVGYNAGQAVSTGTGNTIVGAVAGDALQGGDNNTLIGDGAGGATTAASDLVIIGAGAGAAVMTSDADGTVIIGKGAGAAITSGEDNIAIGKNALASEDDGDGSVAIGFMTLGDQTGVTGDVFNVAVGNKAGKDLTTGIKNTFLGHQAGFATTNVDEAVIIGHGAAQANMTADADGTIAIGAGAGAAITSGIGNTCVGYASLDTEDDGDQNTAFGYKTLSVQTGTSGEVGNTAIGYQAGQFITTATGTTFVGNQCGQGVGATKLTGNNNTGLGSDAGLLLRGAAHSNTFIGATAGDVTTTGVENTCLGFNADIQDATATNQVVIGNNITGTKDNAVFIGNDSSHIENDFNTDATWNHSSDVRQKTNIQDDVLGLNFVNDLRTVTYTHKSPSEFPEEWTAYNPDDTEPMGGGKTIHGFIAQEVKEALDKAGCDTFSGWSVDPDGRQRVSFEAFVMPLIKAVQELSAKVEELEGKLDK